MAWPDTALPYRVRIAPGADLTADPSTWTMVDISADVKAAPRIRTTAGRGDEYSQVPARKCLLTLDNTGGKYSPHNAMSPYYGRLAKNTPIEVSVTPDAYADQFSRTVAGGWGTADSGQVWGTFGGVAADYSVASGVGRHSMGTVGVMRRTGIDVGMSDVDVTVATMWAITQAGGAPVTLWLVGRMVDDSNYYAASLQLSTSGRLTLAMNKRVAGVATNLAAGVDVGAHVGGAWWQVRLQVIGSTIRAKAWNATEPDAWQVVATDTSLTSGTMIALLSRLETGNNNTLPVMLSVDGVTQSPSVRFAGYVSEWPTTWTTRSAKRCLAPIQADDVLRRLAQGTPPAYSPWRHTILGDHPLAYWPCEDGKGAWQAGSAVPGQPPAILSGTAAMGATEYGTGGATTGTPLADNGCTTLADLWGGSITWSLAAPTSDTQWAVQFVCAEDFSDYTERHLMEWSTPGGSYVRWRLIVTASAYWAVVGYDANGAADYLTTVFCNYAGVISYHIDARQSGANIALRLVAHGPGEIKQTATMTLIGKTLTGVVGGTMNPNQDKPASSLLGGHIQVWANPDAGLYDDPTYLAVPESNYWWEPSLIRLARLCREGGIPLNMPSVDPANQIAMGSQPVAARMDLIRQCETIDGGVLYGSGWGLGYLPRWSRYNPPVTLALDNTLGHLADIPQPVDDDAKFRNRFRVQGGAQTEAVAEDTASVQASGPIEDSVQVNACYDNGIADIASWRLHLARGSGLRWSSLAINLRDHPELITAWLACGIGSRVTVAHMRPEATYDDVDAIIEGWTETLGPREWRVDLTTSPTSPWLVCEIGDPVLGRLDTDGSVLAADVTSSAASLSVEVTAGPLWTTDPADMPLDIVVGGERMRVTAVTGATSPQTMTVTRSINGVVKSHLAGEPVHVWQPAVLAL